MEMAFAAMMGWCGTKWPGWWRVPHPHPDPEPWWDLAYGVLGAIGGIAAHSVLQPVLVDGGFVANAATSFFGGTFVATAVSSLMALGGKRG